MLLHFLAMALLSVSSAKYKVVVSEQLIEEVDQRKARREAIDQATDQVTLESVRSEIGEERFRENQKKIDNQVMPLKNRFIPFFKILSSRPEGQGFRFQIEVKVSQKDLALVLQQKGLYSQQSKTGITLPFIEVNSQISGESYRWWSADWSPSKELESLSGLFEKELFQGFLKKGLFLLQPQAFA